jgi:hypothetical protein
MLNDECQVHRHWHFPRALTSFLRVFQGERGLSSNIAALRVDRDASITFLLRPGEALHAYGYSADQLESVMTAAATRLGLSAWRRSGSTPVRIPSGCSKRWPPAEHDCAVSNLFARYRERSPTLTLVPTIVLLVPGSIGFSSLSAVFDRDVVPGVESAFRTVPIAVALAMGLPIADVLVPMRRRLRRSP